MIEPDDELRNVLRQWQTPEPRPELDRRVMRAIAKPRTRTWMAIAAGVLLMVGAAKLWLHPEADAAGFKPLANGEITVLKVGVTQ